eukprot:TRINITY_DN20521_c0_g1_i1.p1 TRINITY_DN20521_c0_g1~~TRINITY_DN20521_c0_g1_i1.p1  ORF type:complete len:107 (-),score=14.44 TRINITY_DN20521_c0_g1_i1:335-655(-)
MELPQQGAVNNINNGIEPAVQQEVYYAARPSMTGQAAVGRVPTPPPMMQHHLWLRTGATPRSRWSSSPTCGPSPNFSFCREEMGEVLKSSTFSAGQNRQVKVGVSE